MINSFRPVFRGKAADPIDLEPAAVVEILDASERRSALDRVGRLRGWLVEFEDRLGGALEPAAPGPDGRQDRWGGEMSAG